MLLIYLWLVERILYDITGRARVECGLTGIGDLRNNMRDDRMESFVLSETLKVSRFLMFSQCLISISLVSVSIIRRRQSTAFR